MGEKMKNTHPVETLPERYKQMVSKSASYINEDVEDIALRLHAEIEKKLIVSFSPAVYGAYLTYLACKLLKNKVLQLRIAEATGVSEASIRNAHRFYKKKIYLLRKGEDTDMVLVRLLRKFRD